MSAAEQEYGTVQGSDEDRHDAGLDSASGTLAAIMQAAKRGVGFTVAGRRYEPVGLAEGAPQHIRGRQFLPLAMAERAAQCSIEVQLDATRMTGVHLPPGMRSDHWDQVVAIVRFTGKARE